jgi:GTPase SAR1 family protein
MGRLKVLIAGDSGIGKTSLIKAIVQSCDHIVHVDPTNPSPISLPQRGSTGGPVRHGTKERPNSRLDTGTTQITEVYASTKPYPEWWSELDDSRVLRRRKSIDEAVLERNICFVDTPGYSSAPSVSDYAPPV